MAKAVHVPGALGIPKTEAEVNRHILRRLPSECETKGTTRVDIERIMRERYHDLQDGRVTVTLYINMWAALAAVVPQELEGAVAETRGRGT